MRSGRPDTQRTGRPASTVIGGARRIDNVMSAAALGRRGMSGLHWAAANAHLDIVTMLTEQGVPLETRNRWGGTVLDATLHFALQHPADWLHYTAVLDTLLAAGADLSAVTYPTGNDQVDGWLRRHGAGPDA